MKFCRLIKPNWAIKKLSDGTDNPNFVKEINGQDIVEGYFDLAFIKEKNDQGYNVYFFPNHPSKNVYTEGVKYLSGRNIDVFNYIFVDMDLKDGVYSTKDDFLSKIRQCSLPPSLVVDSGNGVHVYWKLKDLNRDDYVKLQLALIKAFQTDTSVWTVLQLMRVPGLKNTKAYDNFKLVNVISELSSGNIYSKEEFSSLIGLLSEDELKKAQRHLDKLDGKIEIDFKNLENLDELPDKFLDLMLDNSEVTKLFKDPKSYGDRSKADMKLCNLLFNKNFNIKEALQVISNTQKALEKGLSRMAYAELTVAKVYSDRPKLGIQTVGDFLRNQDNVIKEPPILGPSYIDYGVLGEPWRRKELLGLIAGPGVGKTAFALNTVKEIMLNNPDNDDVYVFFSLEMSKGQVIKRWVKLVGDNTKLADRLYVIDAQKPDGMPLILGLQEMYEYCQEIKKVTGKHIGAVIIDHFHIISTHIDVRKSPNFGIESEQGTGYGNVRNLSFNALATQLKSFVKTLDTFGIILTQTTKNKGVGDLPIGKDGAYGVSQYEWIMDRIISIWQPLMRVQHLCSTNFLAFHYVKIREKHEKDKIKEHDKKLLTYDMPTGNLRITNQNEYQEFLNLMPLANEEREKESKKEPSSYSIQSMSELELCLSQIKDAR